VSPPSIGGSVGSPSTGDSVAVPSTGAKVGSTPPVGATGDAGSIELKSAGASVVGSEGSCNLRTP
jgi:hypothetical protein